MNQQHENGDELLWIILFGCVLVIGIWLIGHEKISAFVMKVRAFESHLLFFDSYGQKSIRYWLEVRRPKDATLGELWRSGVLAGWSLRWAVFIIITGIFGWLIYRSPDRTSKYAKKYSTRELAAQEVAEWPMIAPVLGQELHKVPINDPINGMRQLPRDYARRHGMLVRFSAFPEGANIADYEDLGDRDWALDLPRSKQVFAGQLGRLWQGVGALRPYEQALFAACAAQINNDAKLAGAIINDLALSYLAARKNKKMALICSPKALPALDALYELPAIKLVVSRHAYVKTVLMSMLSAARQNGVLPAAWFRWLKTVDRTTWYALNDLGLDVASIEAAGVRAHWLAETMAKTAIEEPMISPAIHGLKCYLGEILDDENS